MRFERLQDWLDWQEGLHPTAMDLGLERVRAVAGAMAWPTRGFPLVTVAGTNGKGSSVAYLEAIYAAAGYRTGTYTSPHLQRYNERIRIAREAVDDAVLMDAFDRLDRARGDVTITYFEYGTLAAMDLFIRQRVDVAIMEVGIGGRLDAVNIFDADCALVTTVDIDHRKWLGDDRESIGREKAGIFRRGRPAVCAERTPPASVLDGARETGAELAVLGRDYHVRRESDGRWRFSGASLDVEHLPPPGVPGDWQYDNAAGALAVVERLHAQRAVAHAAIRKGIAAPGLRGRYFEVAHAPRIVVDVAHNQQAAAALARNLRADGCKGRTLAVIAMLGDKDLVATLTPLVSLVSAWWVGSTSGPRGLAAAELADALFVAGARRGAVRVCGDAVDALRHARADQGRDDLIIVFGSFHTVGDVMDALEAPERTRG